jgi:hypothetical protein
MRQLGTNSNIHTKKESFLTVADLNHQCDIEKIKEQIEELEK